MIRPMKREEISLCVSLIRASFVTVAEEFGITEENAPRFTAFATTAERLTYQFAEGRPMMVYEKDGAIVGYFSLHQLDETRWELNNLCVHPDFRHQKIGEALLTEAFRQIRETGGKVLEIGIVEENTRLRSWYASYGFLHTGTKKFDFFPFTCGYMKKTL